MYYLQSRYYDADVGRFVNADSAVAGIGGDIQGYNLFSYCFNNPVNMIDATGNWPTWDDIVSTAKKVAESAWALVKGVGGKLGFGAGLGASSKAGVADVSALVKADFQQISFSGYDGFDAGKEMTGKIGGSIAGIDLSLNSGFYHSDLCSQYDEKGAHDTSNCENTEHVFADPQISWSYGIEVYCILGVTAEVSFDIESTCQELIHIWGEEE